MDTQKIIRKLSLAFALVCLATVYYQYGVHSQGWEEWFSLFGSVVFALLVWAFFHNYYKGEQ